MTTEMSWDAIVAVRLCAGDASALAEAYDQLGGYVHNLARRVTNDMALAEDVAQEVFCQLWERPELFKPSRGTLRTFLGVVAHRRAVDTVRRLEAARRREAADSLPAPVQHDIAEEVGAYLAAEELRTALDRLPTEQREPLLLAYFEGYTFRDLARVLGVPEGTAKSRIRLALAKLQNALNEGDRAACR